MVVFEFLDFKIFLIMKFKTVRFVCADNLINFAGKPTFTDFQYK